MTDSLKWKDGVKVTLRTEVGGGFIDAARDIAAVEPNTSTSTITNQLDICRSTTAKIFFRYECMSFL